MQSNARSIARVLGDAGLTHIFTLMGDGNMHLVLALHASGIEVVEVRHESAAVAMAEGYGWSSGRVGVCTVTHGPGLSHTATSLLVAARNRSPLVVLAGETPTRYAGAQRLDQRRLVEACEATYRNAGPEDDAGAVVSAALGAAVERRGPVVVGIPADVIDALVPNAVAAPTPTVAVTAGEPATEQSIDLLLEEIAGAARPVVLAGRGVVASGSAGLVQELAEVLGAGLATTLPVKGLFDGHVLDLGIAGGLTHPDAEPVFARADLVLAIGAGAGASTTRSGRLFPDARLVVLSTDEPGRGDVRVLGEARQSVTVLLARLHAAKVHREPWFPASRPWPECWNEELDYRPPLAPGTLDPRRAVIDLDPVLPADAVLLISNGHCSGFASALLRAAAPRTLHLAQGFGSIGQGLTTAIGVALGAPDRRVVIFEGDAAFLMHASELDTAVRAGARLTAVVFNDEALGTEYHRLRDGEADGPAGELAIVPTPGLAELARAYGATAIRVTDNDDVVPAARAALESRTSVIELRTSRTVESRHLRWRALAAERRAVAEGGTRVR